MMTNDKMRDHRLTMANEDYLEAIYRISIDQDNPEVRSVDIAELLDVSKASVSKALNTLREEGYVEQSRYGKVNLTEEGINYASDLWRCHRMLRVFLTEDLGIDYDIANEEACLMEHAISLETMRAWMDFLEKNHKENGKEQF